MFTGIVRGLCEVVGITDLAGMRKLRVAFGDQVSAEHLEIGASVAINGTCLTVTAFQAVQGRGVVVSFDCIQETLVRTNLGELKEGDRVNVERAMKYGDEVGGHQVYGHVDCVGKVREIRTSQNNVDLFIQFPSAEVHRKYLTSKGWISIDGVSLTVVNVGDEHFSVSLIPETLSRTTLGKRAVGENVNLEFDGNLKIIVQTIERLLPNLLQDHLKK